MSFERDFERTRNGILGTGCFIIVANIIILIAIIFGVVAGCNYIKNKGLKGAVDAVWNGTNTVEEVNAEESK